MVMVDISQELRLLKDDSLSLSEQKMVEDLFRHYLTEFWTKLKEPKLLPELNDVWFWLKMHMLTRLTNEGNYTAKTMLEMELKVNAAKFKNPTFEQKAVVWK